MPKLIYATMIVGNKNVAQNKKLESRSTGAAALFSGMEGEAKYLRMACVRWELNRNIIFGG